ncbi:MAG: dTDP-4-dehydrorhamnose reductase [Candidatus Magasanikbacteria bacterium RIFOXYC2_FULL_42_28]|uniref:dTDP-4-dehydrorhamnose reductase n=1 Tax=Candidatus Magasanikbacteria bacterium RIFOXYC2_FULL_42_28 TaxID=1798704 RepID=A0A1F6NXN2_9BACT|nr:MAG: dTDP-4-dehydrorhamnose reductase [Candidatus Magasanikbacteria bacterium RIFOXYC2_FULL_42_28]
MNTKKLSKPAETPLKKVLILGCQGTLGQALVAEFNLPEYIVVGWDRNEADVTSAQIGRRVIAQKPDIIINATGYNAVDKAETDEAEKAKCFQLNSFTPGKLAKASKEIGAIFVNYSSDYVFRGDKIEGYAENDRPDPISVYGQSKWEGEKFVAVVGGKYYVIRPSRLFGPSDKTANAKKSFVDIMVEKKNDGKIKVVNEEEGCPTYSLDLAYFTRLLVEQKKPYGIYHGVNSGSCNWYGWAGEIFKILNKQPKLIPVLASEFPRAAKRPLYSVLLNTKTEPMRSWQEALVAYLSSLA